MAEVGVVSMICAIEGCERRVHAKGWCEKHYRRALKSGGDPTVVQHSMKGRRGAAHPQWRGDEVTMGSLHLRIQRERGKASEHLCACGADAHEWSYIGGDPDEKLDPRKDMAYSLDLNYYVPRCRSCHRAADVQHGERNPNAKLTDADVVAIRSAVAAGELQRVVAKRFGVGQTHVSRIVRGAQRKAV